MKTSGRVFNNSLIMLTAFFLAAVPFTAQGEHQIDSVSGANSTRVCIREYSKTVEEAFEAGARLIKEADAQLGGDKLFGNIRMRILPEKENGLFVVEVYSFPDNGYCAEQAGYKTPKVTQRVLGSNRKK